MKRNYIALSHILSASSNSSLLISLSAHSIFAMNESVLPEINPVSTDAKHSAARLMSRLEFEDALKKCEETEKEWYDNAKLIDTMLIHDYVDNIGLSISKMTAFAQKQNRDMYFAESVQAKKELASIKESEFPLVENIL